MNRRALALTAAAATAVVVGGGALAFTLANADPGNPEPTTSPALDGPCAESLDGAVTELPGQADDGRRNFIECRNGAWQSFTAEYPSSDRWLSNDTGLELHGQGVRNAEMFAGTWTGTPQSTDGVCTVAYSDATGGKIADPVTATAEPGQPVTFEASNWLFSITLTGDCLWQRS